MVARCSGDEDIAIDNLRVVDWVMTNVALYVALSPTRLFSPKTQSIEEIALEMQLHVM